MATNSGLWFDFLERSFPQGKGRVRVETDDRDEGGRLFDLVDPDSSSTEGFTFLGIHSDSAGFEEEIHSGEVSENMVALDKALRVAWAGEPALPLFVTVSPNRPWPRSQIWMLGEYLAERDLCIWVDLSDLEANAATSWARRIVDFGLACPRVTVRLATDSEEAKGPLKGTGVWVLVGENGGETARVFQG